MFFAASVRLKTACTAKAIDTKAVGIRKYFVKQINVRRKEEQEQ